VLNMIGSKLYVQCSVCDQDRLLILYVSDVKLSSSIVRDFHPSKLWTRVVVMMQCHWVLFDV
jgi:hypothetical protein